MAFAQIFAGMRVRTGLNACGEVDEIEVPVRYGSTDRVASAIGGSNTQNKLHTLPVMSCYMTGIELAPDRQHGIGGVDRRTYLEQGAVFPDEVKAIKRVVPVPYNLQMELSLYASSTEQGFQILEQIMLLFDGYDLQIQLNDAPFDWGKITKTTLTGFANEENYPVGPDRRVFVWTLSFDFPIWISLPYEVRNEIVQRIAMQWSNLDDCVLEEIGPDGELLPFEPFGQPTVADGTVEPPAGGAITIDPVDDVPDCREPQHYDPTKEPCSPPDNTGLIDEQ